ncbi:MAG: hypothetical protein AAFY56_04695 [Pseudomonadota bacterium]
MSSRGASTLDQTESNPAPLALMTLLVAAVIIVCVIVILTFSAGRVPDRSGKLLAVFPPSTPAATIFEAVTRTDGKVMAQTMVPGVIEVFSDSDGFSGRLLRHGAKLVLPQPGRMLTIGGCSYLALDAYDRRSGKLQSGPM